MTEMSKDQFTLKEVIENIKSLFLYLLAQWKVLIGGAIAFTLLVLLYNYARPKQFSASTSFVLQNADSGLNEISSLASIAGVNLGGLSESSDLFQIDNIQELYRSHRMIATTLLTFADFPEGRDLLVNRYIENREFRQRWKGEPAEGIQFALEDFGNNRLQDSLLIEFSEVIRNEHLSVAKPSRKLSILNVTYTDKDPYFAKAFNEHLVNNVNEFYKQTMTQKTGRNLKILSTQADSVKRVLDESMFKLAELQESAPNRNPLYKTALVEEQQVLIDLAASRAIYETVVTNLELAKVSHRNNMPLIQVIDFPILPLPHSRWKLLKAIIIGLLIGGSATLATLIARRFVVQIMND